jgi:hypothetical protein
MEKPLATPSYQLLLQKDATLLVISDGGAIINEALSALRTSLPLCLASLHVRCEQDEMRDFDLLSELA